MNNADVVLLQANLCLALELLTNKESIIGEMPKAIKILGDCRNTLALHIMGSVQKEVIEVALGKFIPMKGYVKNKLTTALELLSLPRLTALSKSQFDIIQRARFNIKDGIEYLLKLEEIKFGVDWNAEGEPVFGSLPSVVCCVCHEPVNGKYVLSPVCQSCVEIRGVKLN